MYLANDSGITLRVQRVLAAALGGPVMGETLALEEVTAEEIRKRAVEHITGLPSPKKAGRMRAILDAYLEGKNINQVAVATDVSKACVSGHLAELEIVTGCRVVRGRLTEGASFAARMRADASVLHVMRKNGARRASVRDFHSFRVTWITSALAAGVPLEIVQRVTGLKTVDVVLKHYFRPGRDDFRRTLEAAVPRLFNQPAGRAAAATAIGVQEPWRTYGEAATPAEMARSAIAALEEQTAKNWKAQRDVALGAMRSVVQWLDGHILHEKPAEFART